MKDIADKPLQTLSPEPVNQRETTSSPSVTGDVSLEHHQPVTGTDHINAQPAFPLPDMLPSCSSAGSHSNYAMQPSPIPLAMTWLLSTRSTSPRTRKAEREVIPRTPHGATEKCRQIQPVRKRTVMVKAHLPFSSRLVKQATFRDSVTNRLAINYVFMQQIRFIQYKASSPSMETPINWLTAWPSLDEFWSESTDSRTSSLARSNAIERLSTMPDLAINENNDDQGFPVLDPTLNADKGVCPTLRDETFTQDHQISKARKGDRFSSEDDELLKRLKDDYLLWKTIAAFFPGRLKGSLQTRYCTKLKWIPPENGRDWMRVRSASLQCSKPHSNCSAS